MRRRNFLIIGGAALAAGAPSIDIGVTDWSLGMAGEPAALELARKLGFAGVELSLGRKPVDGRLPLDDAGLQAQYLAKTKQIGLPLVSTCLDILHVNGLKNDKLGQKWLGDAIEINRKMGIRNMLMPFFSQRAMETRAEMDYVGDVLRDFGPLAEKAGVTLGLEDTNTAADNVHIMERSRSAAVKVWYDIGNSFTRGYDIYKEIRWLGKERICHFHLKDNPAYMGEGRIDFPAVLAAISDIGWKGFADLETSSPSKDIAADMAKNLGYLRGLLRG